MAAVTLVVGDGHGAVGTGLRHAVLQVHAALVGYVAHLLQQQSLSQQYTGNDAGLLQSLDGASCDDASLVGHVKSACGAADWKRTRLQPCFYMTSQR